MSHCNSLVRLVQFSLFQLENRFEVIRHKMKLIVQPLKLIDILAFAWTGIKLFLIECRRYYYREETVVETKSGLVKGFKIASSFDYSYFNFIGIPYAKPPIGELRFKVRLVLSISSK